MKHGLTKVKDTLCIVIDDYYSHGGTQQYCYLAASFLKNYYDVEILSLKGKSSAGVIGLDFKKNIQVFLSIKKITDILKEYNYVLVISGQISLYLFPFLYNLNVIHRESNSPIIRMKNEFFFKKLFQFILFKVFTLQSSNHKVIVPSTFVGKNFRSFKNVRIIDNFIEPLVFPKLQDISKLGYVGRPTYLKGFDRFIRICKKNNSVKFVHIGDSSNFKLANLESVGYKKNKLSIYNKISTLLLLSRTEGFPNVINEAIQFGINIVISKELSWLLDIDYVKPFIVFCGDEHQICKFLINYKSSYVDRMTLEFVTKHNKKVENQIISFFNNE